MEDKQLTPRESMALINAMIQQSKHRVTMADIRVSVMWGILTIVTAIMVTVLLVTMRDPVYNYGWFAIPAIGIPLNILTTPSNTVLAKTHRSTETYRFP